MAIFDYTENSSLARFRKLEAPYSKLPHNRIKSLQKFWIKTLISTSSLSWIGICISCWAWQFCEILAIKIEEKEPSWFGACVPNFVIISLSFVGVILPSHVNPLSGIVEKGRAELVIAKFRLHPLTSQIWWPIMGFRRPIRKKALRMNATAANEVTSSEIFCPFVFFVPRVVPGLKRPIIVRSPIVAPVAVSVMSNLTIEKPGYGRIRFQIRIRTRVRICFNLNRTK